MSLTKRRISRRALGVVVGASLLVLGLEAPAFADSAVTAVSPTSGPEDCVVVVTGTGFNTFPDAQNTLTFVGPVAGDTDDVDAVDWFSISDTEIWAAVPALAVGTTYSVVLTQPSGTNTAGGTFLSTGVAGGAAGGCAPTIASFTPDCGSAGTVVTITGTNLLDASNLLTVNSGADVFFRSTAVGGETEATYPVPDPSSPTSIQAIVPSGVVDGPIRVLTDVDANASTPLVVDGVFSTTSFLTPPPDCQLGGETHARSISLTLRRHLIAKGAVTVEDDTAECIAGVPVKIQRRKKGGGWKNVGSTTTTDAGKYKRAIKDRPGKYRAVAPAVTLADDSVCSKAVSPRVRHRH
jgi:hypothetical protein